MNDRVEGVIAAAVPEAREASHCFVVPAYGDSPFLADCLRSLREQIVEAEILLTTSTPSPFIDDVASTFSVPVVINPARHGIAADWNFALGASSARLITIAHQDDVYFPAFLQRTLELFATRADAAACFTGYQEIDDTGAPATSKISLVKHGLQTIILGERTTVEPGRLRMFLSFGNPLPCSSVTLNRAGLGDFRFAEGYQSNLDWDAWLRLADGGRIFVRTSERLVGRRHNPLTATSRLIKDGVRAREDLDMFRRLWPSPMAELIAFVYRAGY